MVWCKQPCRRRKEHVQTDIGVPQELQPNRSTQHAIARCQQAMLTGFTWVIERDVKACFDEISHKAILGCLRER